MDHEEVGINAGNLVDSGQDKNYWRALVNAAFNLRVPHVMDLGITRYINVTIRLHVSFVSCVLTTRDDVNVRERCL